VLRGEGLGTIAMMTCKEVSTLVSMEQVDEAPLRQILRVARREPHAPSGSIESPPMFVHHRAKRDRIPRPQALQGIMSSKRHSLS
jgi:hypothetical protein